MAAASMAEVTDDALMREVSDETLPAVRERAFRDIVARHAGALCGFVRCYVSRAHEVDDLVQETFLRVYLARERYVEGKASFRTWLFRIARNLVLDHRRREALRRARSLDADEESPPEVAGAGKDPLTSLIDAHALDAVARALLELPEADREVVSLRFHEDLGYDEIAAIVGGTAAATKQRAWRALQRLRALLGPALGIEEVEP